MGNDGVKGPLRGLDAEEGENMLPLVLEVVSLVDPKVSKNASLGLDKPSDIRSMFLRNSED